MERSSKANLDHCDTLMPDQIREHSGVAEQKYESIQSPVPSGEGFSERSI